MTKNHDKIYITLGNVYEKIDHYCNFLLLKTLHSIFNHK